MTAAATSALPARKPPVSERRKKPRAPKTDPLRAQLFAEHLTLLALGKACYKRADVILEALLLHKIPEEVVTITSRQLAKKSIRKTLRESLKLIFATIDGQKFAISDKYADRNSVPVGQNARRFEIAGIKTNKLIEGLAE